MDFSKFVSLLDKSALFFSRADKLGDPFEGSFSKANASIRNGLYKDLKAKGISEASLSELYKQVQKFTAISCWHINRCESAAMWQLYLKSNEGIAIRSNFERLRKSLKKYESDIVDLQIF